ncbi:MAG: uroporphyrinogen-III synthase [Magnetovibrio sp.]|nr:uroporphyrinogen-III synthase [Magnetovibrio sp.]
MRVMITRPHDDAAPLAASLREFGVESLIEPLLAIDYFDGPALDLDGVQAYLLTSANGARALAGRTPDRGLPVLAVGDATARAAKDLGFSDVRSASGDVDTLAALASGGLDPATGALLHPAGTEVAGDLGGAVGGAGFEYRREALYAAAAAEAFSADARKAIAEGTVDGALLFSPRTGATFKRLVEAAGLAAGLRRVRAYCLSAAVAEQVRELPWLGVDVAVRPDQQALVDLLR